MIKALRHANTAALAAVPFGRCLNAHPLLEHDSSIPPPVWQNRLQLLCPTSPWQQLLQLWQTLQLHPQNLLGQQCGCAHAGSSGSYAIELSPKPAKGTPPSHPSPPGSLPLPPLLALLGREGGGVVAGGCAGSLVQP